MYVLLHSDDIGQRMNLRSIERRDIVTETFEDGQYGSRIVKLGIWA